MDLRNRQCTEYLTFSDTATVQKQYTLPDSVSITGGSTLFIDKEVSHTKPVEVLSDTIIESIQYRRLKFIDSDNKISPVWICYFRCDKIGSTISYFGGFKEKDGCPMTKYDMLIDGNNMLIEGIIC